MPFSAIIDTSSQGNGNELMAKKQKSITLSTLLKQLGLKPSLAVVVEPIYFNLLGQMLDNYSGCTYTVVEIEDGKYILKLSSSPSSDMLCSANYQNFVSTIDTLSLTATARFYHEVGLLFHEKGNDDIAAKFFNLFYWVRDIATYTENENPKFYELRTRNFPDANPSQFLSFID